MRTLSDIRHPFLDMDGTIYHGGRLYPTTLPFLRFLANRKIGVTFLYGLCERVGYIGVVHALGRICPEIFHLVPSVFEVLDKPAFVFESGVVAADTDFHDFRDFIFHAFRGS